MREWSGTEQNTTNNRMELRAAIEGLKALKEDCAVEVITDSEYLKNGITTWIHNWKRRGWMVPMACHSFSTYSYRWSACPSSLPERLRSPARLAISALH